MELLRYLIFAYAIIGTLIAGGLLFSRNGKASTFLAIFALIYAIEESDFLYQTSSLVEYYPQFYLLWFPICLLSGPAIWFHLTQIESPSKIELKTYLGHLLPFFCYTVFTLYLLTYSGTERVTWVSENYSQIIQPLNYGKTLHVIVYAILAVRFIQKNKERRTFQQQQYFTVLGGIYCLTAVLLTYLTAFVDHYIYFVSYFIGASTLVLFGAYVLYYHPTLFQELKQKYAKSGLAEMDKKRIALKLSVFFSKVENVTDRSINLDKLCQQIQEQKHHVSQTLSDEFKASFRELINRSRVDYAKQLLQDRSKQDLKILAIAFESGFSNKSTFNRAFQKFAHCTPNEFRQKTGCN
ncbi:MAG: helix-turn-helix domain-containing protein [Bacteroidota bacterium]